MKNEIAAYVTAMINAKQREMDYYKSDNDDRTYICADSLNDLTDLLTFTEDLNENKKVPESLIIKNMQSGLDTLGVMYKEEQSENITCWKIINDRNAEIKALEDKLMQDISAEQSELIRQSQAKRIEELEGDSDRMNDIVEEKDNRIEELETTINKQMNQNIKIADVRDRYHVDNNRLADINVGLKLKIAELETGIGMWRSDANYKADRIKNLEKELIECQDRCKRANI